MDRYESLGVCLLIILAVVNSMYIDDSKKPFSLEEATSGMFSGEIFNGTWISENEIFYRANEFLLKFDVTTRGSQIIARSSQFDERTGMRFTPSPDAKYVLIRNISETVYRHSSLNTYSIYDVEKGNFIPLANEELLSTAIWAPKGNAIAYVLKNDIYYYKVHDKEARRLTFDGELQAVYNGVPDWVYEEEVFAADRTMWFSPNGEQLAFATFNDTEVPEAVILRYGEPGDLKYQYPTEEKFRYPKAGATNPRVSLNLIDLTRNESKLKPLQIPTDVVGSEPILFAVGWFDSNTLVAKWTNRVQNLAQIGSYSLSGQWQPLHTEEVPNGWLLYPTQVPVYHNGYVLMLTPQPVVNKTLGSFGHLVRYRFLNGQLDQEEDLTPGNMWVHQIHGINDLKQVVYFTASPPDEPSQKHLYEVSLKTPKESKPTPLCVSCTVMISDNNKCEYVLQSTFSTDFSRYVLTCSGQEAPSVSRIYDFDRNMLYSWTENSALRLMLEKRMMPKRKNLYVESGGFTAKVRLMLPPNFDESKKYPMLVNVYGGPESQRINDYFAIGIDSYMTTNREVIYAYIDGRGSSTRGTAMLYAIYRKLGNFEMEDQINVTRRLQRIFSWIDSERTAIWGWSYGGYATATILTKDDDNVFKCGVSVAPVTHWFYYDSIYTERYMGLPTKEDNLKNYESTSVLSHFQKFNNKKFLLVHGTGDDNVHYQQSMLLAKELMENDIPFEQVSYPDEAHALAHVHKHLYHTLDKFWGQCLGYSTKRDSN